MSGTTLRIARRFFALGGRLMIDPAGKLVEGISMAALFGLDLSDRERAHALRVNRAIEALGRRRRAETRRLIQQHGHALPSGWVVWGVR